MTSTIVASVIIDNYNYGRFLNDAIDSALHQSYPNAEVIVVEWNPPVDRPRLETLLRLPERHVCVYRFIQVPPELHQQLQYADVLPLFQWASGR